MAPMNSLERMHYYNQYVTAAIALRQAYEKLENVKDFYERGYVDEEKVRAVEEEYLAAKAEADRLWRLSEYGPEPDKNKRWEPKQRING